MFTGIIESTGKIQEIVQEGTNLMIRVSAEMSHELKVDQSLNHDGVCLTVTRLGEGSYWVTAIKETLSKTSLGKLSVGSEVNLERAMKADGRFDGHIVQGHVDTVARVASIKEEKGSWLFTFSFDDPGELLVEKGSICVNGVSLTCFDISANGFSVAIIPYTYSYTNFKNLKKGDVVNIEFDILGKYIKKLINKPA